MTAPARPGLAETLCSADASWPHHDATDDYPCSACKAKAAVAAQWLADELASDEMREAVRDAILDVGESDYEMDYADAAVAAVRATVGGGR